MKEMVPAGITEKRPFLRLAEKQKQAKICFSPKKHSKKAKRLIFIGEKGTFPFDNFSRSWLEHG